MDKLARLFQKWGATDAVNLDGGYSSMMVIRNKVVSVKPQQPKPSSEEKSKPVSEEIKSDKKIEQPKQEKQNELNVQGKIPDTPTETTTKSADQVKNSEDKAALERKTISARGNRRVRPMPRFQGRSVSDAILIFPRKSDHR